MSEEGHLKVVVEENWA